MPATALREATAIDEAERLRSGLYHLLVRFLARPPDAALLREAAGWSGDDSRLGAAVRRLAACAGTATPAAAREEYEALFIGLSRGELVPYASYYLTGFLHEKPLARVRQSLRELGAERDPAASEPEDHIAALLDVMAGLIAGAFGPPQPLAVQKRFHDDHIASWAPYFFRDLEAAESARLYAPIGSIGREFLQIEQAAFAMA